LEDIKNKISLKNELLRKAIHLSSSVVPISYLYLSKDIEVFILCVISTLMIIVDLTRTRVPVMRDLYLRYLQPILRSHELEDNKPVFTGGTYLILAYLLCVIIFPKPISVTAMFIIIFSDSAAAIFGKVYGKHFIGNKTIEGSLAFFISAVIIIILTPKMTGLMMEYYIGIVSALLTTVFELLPLKIDDNLSIPLFFGAIYFIQMKLFM
ncbi:MAG: diacylglycerol/polyprenol kinase family protein, partial [Ignavibacteria bacterium]